MPGLPILFKKDLTLGSVAYSEMVQFCLIILKAINVIFFPLVSADSGVPLSLSLALLQDLDVEQGQKSDR